MGEVSIELNEEGVRELLRSSEMMGECYKHASSAMGRLGSGYSVDKYTGPNRVNVQISAESFKARQENMANNTILRALGGVSND